MRGQTVTIDASVLADLASHSTLTTSTGVDYSTGHLLSQTGVLMYNPSIYSAGSVEYSTSNFSIVYDQATVVNGLIYRLDSLFRAILGVGISQHSGDAEFLQFIYNSENELMKAVTNINSINSLVLEDIDFFVPEESPKAFEEVSDMYRGFKVWELLEAARIRTRCAALRNRWNSSRDGLAYPEEHIGLMSPGTSISVLEKVGKLSAIKTYLATNSVTNATIAISLLANMTL